MFDRHRSPPFSPPLRADLLDLNSLWWLDKRHGSAHTSHRAGAARYRKTQ